MPALIDTLPPLFVERLARIYPPRTVAAILPLFAVERPTTFRVNTLVTTVDALRRALTDAGFQLERVPWSDVAFVLKRGTTRELTATPAYHAGAIYVQSLSSMLPPLVLQPQPGERVLDLTAAPGSKTTQLAVLMRNDGVIIANDNNAPRFFKLMANVKLQQATCVECTQWYGETIWRRYGETFDRVLVDAPCSAEGRFNVREPRSFGYWKPRKVREMARKQKRLLYSGIRSLKPGGMLVYSTCTFAPEENEAVVSWALEKFHGVVEAMPARVPVPNVVAPLARWNDRAFDPAVRCTVRILPTATMEGFFLAKLHKMRSIPADS